MRRFHIPSRVTAAVLSAVILSQSVLADAAVSSVWSDRRRPAEPVAPAAHTAAPAPLPVSREFGAVVSPAFGTIRRAGAGNGTHGRVLLIQDVHLNAEAQKNIASAVKALAGRGAVDLIGLEGSARRLPVEALRESPDAESFRLASGFLLEKDAISGAVHAALTADRPVRVDGIDDAALHARNADAYRGAQASKAAFASALAAETARIAQAKSIYSAQLAAFDASVQAHRAGTLTFGGYLAVLAKEADRLEIPVSSDLRSFLEAATLEKSLDLARVERERNAVLRRLSERLATEEATDLLRAGLAFRAREIGHAEFYRRFAALCARAGLKESEAPELQRYFRYIALADAADAAGTLRAAHRLETDIYARLATTKNEQRLVSDDRAAHLAGKLSSFGLTRDEWDEWSASGRAFPGAENFERFYAVAVQRDKALADNLLSRLNEKDGAAVAVVGGFHAPRVAERLASAGCAVSVFTPALSRADVDGSAYLSVFAREKTPLEQLFEGQKLFLASDPLSDAAAASLVTMTAARAAVLDRPTAGFGAWSRRAIGLLLVSIARRGNAGARIGAITRDGESRTLELSGVTRAGFAEMPRPVERPTGTFALGRRLFSPFTDRWVAMTLRFSPVLELPQIYLSAFSRRFRDAFLTPGWNLPQKRDALAAIHSAMGLAAALGAIAGAVGFATSLLAMPAMPATVVTGASFVAAGAALFSLFPALWLHDAANRTPETRLTEGNPGGYMERLIAFLAELRGPPNVLDTQSSDFQALSEETRKLILESFRRHDNVFDAWMQAYSHYRAPFEDFLSAVFLSWHREFPNHAIQAIETLYTPFLRHQENDRAGDLVGFVAQMLAKAVQATAQAKVNEFRARTSDPIRILEVTAEVRPFAPVGGLGVVLGTLPSEMNKFHAWDSVYCGYYTEPGVAEKDKKYRYDWSGEDSSYSAPKLMPFTFTVTILGEAHVTEVYRVVRRNDDGTSAEFFFGRDTFPGEGNLTQRPYQGLPWSIQGIKQAVFLSEGALQLAKYLRLNEPGRKNFDVIRGHDWAGFLAPIFVKTRAYAEDPDMRAALAGVRAMGFFHNLEPGYRGEFNPEFWKYLGLDEMHKQSFSWERMEGSPRQPMTMVGFNAKEYSLAKALLFHADGMFVPAPTYAKMIQDEAYGYDIASGFRVVGDATVGGKVYGILNGNEYDPKDERIFPMGRRSRENFLEHKYMAKMLLLKETGMYEKIEEEVRSRLGLQPGEVNEAFNREMDVEIDRPIYGAVLRLDTKMKGVWHFRSVGERLTDDRAPHPIRVVLLGSPLDSAESKSFVTEMQKLADARPSRVAFFPIGGKNLAGANAAAARRINLGKPIRTLNDLIQSGADGFFPSRVEPGGIADVEAMSRGAFVIVSDKGGFADKARDFEDPTITDREPTGIVVRGPYEDYEDKIRAIERAANLYYSNRRLYEDIWVNNKNLRFWVRDQARSHVVAIATLIGRTDVAENPEKPVRQTVPGAIGFWRLIGLTNPAVIGAVEGAAGILFVALSVLALGAMGITPTLPVIQVVTLAATGVALAGFWAAHYFFGVLDFEGRVSRMDPGLATRATGTAASGFIGSLFVIAGFAVPGDAGTALLAIAFAVGAFAHGVMNRLAASDARLNAWLDAPRDNSADERAQSASPASPAPISPEDEDEALYGALLRSSPSIYEPARDELTRRLESDDANLRNRALKIFGKIATTMDREILTPRIVERTLEILETRKFRQSTASDVFDILTGRRDLATPRTLRAIEDALMNLKLGREGVAFGLTALLVIADRHRDFIAPSSLTAAEAIMKKEGFRADTYRLATQAMTTILQKRPELARRGSLHMMIFASPEGLRRHPWPHYDLLRLVPFPTDMAPQDRYAIGLAAWRLLNKLRIGLTLETAVAAVNAIRRQREARAGQVLIGPGRTFVRATHTEERFEDERLERIALKSGVDKSRISAPFSGAETKRPFIRAITEAQGPLTVYFDGHGGPNHVWLTQPVNEMSSDLTSTEGVSYSEMGDALLEHARRNGDPHDLSRVSIFLDSCYSYDFAEHLQKYLVSIGVEKAPTVISAAGKHRESFSSTMTKLYDALPAGPIDLAAVFKVETDSFAKFDFTDFGIFTGADGEITIEPGSPRPLRYMELGAVASWKSAGVTNPAAIGALEGLAAGLLVLIPMLALSAFATAPGAGDLLRLSATVSGLVIAGFWAAHHFLGVLGVDGRAALRDPRRATSATLTAATGLAGVPFFVLAALTAGPLSIALASIGLAAGALAHGAVNAAIARYDAAAPVPIRVLSPRERRLAAADQRRQDRALANALRRSPPAIDTEDDEPSRRGIDFGHIPPSAPAIRVYLDDQARLRVDLATVSDENRAIIERYRAPGVVDTAYLAGGYVRDLLLGRAPKDVDAFLPRTRSTNVPALVRTVLDRLFPDEFSVAGFLYSNVKPDFVPADLDADGRLLNAPMDFSFNRMSLRFDGKTDPYLVDPERGFDALFPRSGPRRAVLVGTERSMPTADAMERVVRFMSDADLRAVADDATLAEMKSLADKLRIFSTNLRRSGKPDQFAPALKAWSDWRIEAFGDPSRPPFVSVHPSVRMAYALGNASALGTLAMDPDPIVATHATWALQAMLRSASSNTEAYEPIYQLKMAMYGNIPLIDAETVDAVLDVLEGNRPDIEQWEESADFFRSIAEEHPDLLSPRVVTALTSVLARPGLKTDDFVSAGTALKAVFDAAPELADVNVVQSIQNFFATEGYDAAAYGEMGDVLAKIQEKRPELIRDRSLSALLLAMDPMFRRHSFSHYQIFGLGDVFPADLSPETGYTISLVAYRLMKRHNLAMTTDNARRAVQAVMRERLRTADDVLIGPDTKVIRLLHSEARFDGDRLARIARNAGVPAEKISREFRGRDAKSDALIEIYESKGPTAILFDGHGGTNHIWMDAGHPGESEDTAPRDAISFVELGNALIARAKVRTNGGFDLSDVTILLESCYSHNFAQFLLGYLAGRNVDVLPTVATSSNSERLSYGDVFFTALETTAGKNPLTVGHVYEAETRTFKDKYFADFALFANESRELRAELASGAEFPYVELGLSGIVGKLLSPLRNATAIAASGAAVESLFILAAIPAVFLALGVTFAPLIVGVQMLAFPALHLTGIVRPLYDNRTGVTLRSTTPTPAGLLRVFVLGVVIHALMPGMLGLVAHIVLNSILVKRVEKTPAGETEARLARTIALAAFERAKGRTGANWRAAMRSLIGGRAARLGVGGGTMDEIDGAGFDRALFDGALNREMRTLGLKSALAPKAAFDVASDIAYAGLRETSMANAVTDLKPGQVNVIVAENLPEASLAALVARLRAEPTAQALLILKEGSPKSDAVARAMAGLANVTAVSGDGIYAEGDLTRVRLAGLDRMLKSRGGADRVHLFAGKSIEFDAAGLAEDSALRQALFTILDAMSVTAGFPRVDLLDSLYRLMASQA